MRAKVATVAAVAASVYVAILVVDPLLNPDLDVLGVHPEDYASGDFGFLVNLSYIAVATALVALVTSLYPGRRWSALSLATLLPPVALSVALAAAPPAVSRSGAWVSIAVIGLGVAPLLISAVMGGRLGRLHRLCVVLGAVVLVAFVALATSPESVSGLVNRVFDIAAGVWTATAALATRATLLA